MRYSATAPRAPEPLIGVERTHFVHFAALAEDCAALAVETRQLEKHKQQLVVVQVTQFNRTCERHRKQGAVSCLLVEGTTSV